ncbi:MAG: DedA family protein [Bacteroidaceae bacterium]|nr:DedA family protein [Bacteroidaceae bacterium]
MEQLYDALISYGPWGMFISAFLAGSILPFSSEAIMVALLAAGVDPWILLLTASAGNTLGGITCYCIGRTASPEWLQRTFRIKDKHMHRAQVLVARWGAWMGLLCPLPILGDAILVTLGIMRSRPLATNLTMAIGRTLRYAFVLLSALGVAKLLW